MHGSQRPVAEGSGDAALPGPTVRIASPAARPRISIRLRIGVSMGVCFALTVAVAVAWIVSVEKIGRSQQLLEDVNLYLFELDQARRFEKDYLLYQTNLGDAFTHVGSAHGLLRTARAQVESSSQSRSFDAIDANLAEYDQLLEQLAALDAEGAGERAAARATIESRLRKSGARAIDDGRALRDRERLRLHTMMHLSKIAATVGILVVLLIIAYLANHLSQQTLKQLERFVAYAQRIAGGDYSPIQPVRKYQDEFSDLVAAINRMLGEIKSHEEKLARSSRMAAVGTLTAGIAHELNNPLNNIGLTAEALLEEDAECSAEERLQLMRDIQTQVERASATVRDLLDFTRVEEPVMVPVAVAELIVGCTRLLAHEARRGNVEFRLNLKGEIPAIRANARALQQVFLNLFLNAIQAMPEGGVISVVGGEEGGWARIDIRDNGVGIAAEDLESIFDPFFTTKEVGVGTGLGLAVSYGIVVKHGGRLEVSSRLGEGTIFSLYLPGADALSAASEV
jgi:signal transduction histidine kinase